MNDKELYESLMAESSKRGAGYTLPLLAANRIKALSEQLEECRRPKTFEQSVLDKLTDFDLHWSDQAKESWLSAFASVSEYLKKKQMSKSMFDLAEEIKAKASAMESRE